MQKPQGNTTQALRALQGFLPEHADQLPTVVGTGAHRKLDESIAELFERISEQQGIILARRGMTETQRVLRLVLVRDHMRPIARIARAARNELPKTPAVESLQALPRTGGAEKLLAGAYGMAKAAEPFAKVFTDAALPADFRDRLTDAADAFSASLKEGAGLRSQQTGATEGLRRAMAAARRQVQVIDALVQTAWADQPALLASWNTIRHVKKTAVRATAPVVVTPAAPAVA